MTALVLLPGMDGTGALFGPLLDALPTDIRAIVVRYPDRPAAYPEHVSAARHELPTDEPFVLLGESFSGPVAVSLAATAPPGLTDLILCASFLTCPSALLRLLRPLTPFASPKLVPAFIAQRSLLGRFATPALRTAHADALRRVSSRALTSRLRAMADVDVRKEMRNVRVPTLYLRGTADRIVGAAFGDEVVANATNCRIAEFDAPHFLLQARPAESAVCIARFLESVAA